MRERDHYLSREQISELLDERDTLREQVRQLEELIAPVVVLPPEWRLSTHEGILLAALRKVGPNVLHRERAMMAIYGMWDDAPDQKIVDVLLSRVRHKMKSAGTGIDIETVWGRGWRLSAEACRAFDRAIAEEAARYPAAGPVPLSRVA